MSLDLRELQNCSLDPSGRKPHAARWIDWVHAKCVLNDKGCWVWTGLRSAAGYGQIDPNGRRGPRVPVHRFTYEHHVGPIPAGLDIDHICRVRACCNPAHLRAVTRQVNLTENCEGMTWQKLAARETCEHGHPLSGDNLIIRRHRNRVNPSRRCRTCKNAAAARRYARKRAAALAAAAAMALSSCSLAVAARGETSPPPKRASVDVSIFCGPDPIAPHWRRQLATLASIGVTAVHGPCRTPPADYSVLRPGSRYASQAEYLTLAAEARLLRIGVIVYDPTFWTDPAAAAAVWGEYIADGTLVAVDLGDEPGWSDMAELNRRAELVRTAGVEPQVIYLNGRLQNVIEQHRALPTTCPTSDDYEHNGDAINDAAMLRFEAGCAGIAIDTTGRDLDGDGDRWSLAQIDRAQAAGYRLTLFTGVRPDNFPTWDALVDDLGRATPAGLAVKEALR